MTAHRLMLAAAVLLLLAAASLAGEAAPEPQKKLNPTLVNMPVNTWVKLKPDREPEGRSYSGVCYGNGKILYFGGGHGSYTCNDVEVYDVAANTWKQLTEPEDWRDADKWTHLSDEEKKKVKGIGGGWGVPYLSPKGRPLTEHTFQMKAWLPEEKAFYLLISKGLWSFDTEKREWTLVTDKHPGRADIHTWNLTYDPELKTVISISGAGDPGIWVFDREAKALKRKYDASPGRCHIYSTYDSSRKLHIGVANGKWFALNTASGEIKTLKSLPITKGLGAVEPSLEYDPASKTTLVVTYDCDDQGKRIGGLKTFAYDFDKDEWSEFKLAGEAPTGAPDFDYLVYDPDHKCHLFVNVLSVQGSARWGGKVDGVFAFRYERKQ
jgi:hypothetical protein